MSNSKYQTILSYKSKHFKTAMKKLKILTWLIVFVTSPLLTNAQIHVKGLKFADIQVGTVDGIKYKGDNSGIWVAASAGKYNKNENSFRWQLEYLQRNFGSDFVNSTIPVRQYNVGFGYANKIIKSRNRAFYTNLTGAIIGGYESVNNNKSEIGLYKIGNKSKFMAGAEVGVEIEIERFVLVGKQRWIPSSSTKDFYLHLGLGYRFNR